MATHAIPKGADVHRSAKDGQLFTEASAIGLAPGHWPDYIEHEGVLFAKRTGSDHGVRYTSGQRVLWVWND